MHWMHNLSIKWKLMLVILLTSILVVFLACAALLVQELIVFRQSLAREATILADVLGRNSTAALSFGDEGAAQQIMEALRAEPHITAAALYSTKTGLFAEYLQVGTVREIPNQPGAVGHHFEPDRLVLFHPITLNGNRVGTIFLQSDLRGMHDRLKSYAFIVGLILLGAGAAAFGLSAGLQGVISKPILALAAAARNVRESKDYSVRVAARGQDETSQLTNAFNQMLAEIEARQIALQQANQSLLAQAGQILESVGVLSTSAREISSFSTQLAASATESATAVTQTTTTVEEVRQTTQLASQKAQQVADNAQKTAEITQLGKQSTEATMAGMQRIRQQMDSLADSMVGSPSKPKPLAKSSLLWTTSQRSPICLRSTLQSRLPRQGSKARGLPSLPKR